MMEDKIIFLNSRVIDNKTKSSHLPDPSTIEYGEIVINYKTNYEVLAFKNDSNNIVVIPSEKYIQNNINSITRKIYYQEDIPSISNEGDIWLVPIKIN